MRQVPPRTIVEQFLADPETFDCTDEQLFSKMIFQVYRDESWKTTPSPTETVWLICQHWEGDVDTIEKALIYNQINLYVTHSRTYFLDTDRIADSSPHHIVDMLACAVENDLEEAVDVLVRSFNVFYQKQESPTWEMFQLNENVKKIEELYRFIKISSDVEQADGDAIKSKFQDAIMYAPALLPKLILVAFEQLRERTELLKKLLSTWYGISTYYRTESARYTNVILELLLPYMHRPLYWIDPRYSRYRNSSYASRGKNTVVAFRKVIDLLGDNRQIADFQGKNEDELVKKVSLFDALFFECYVIGDKPDYLAEKNIEGLFYLRNGAVNFDSLIYYCSQYQSHELVNYIVMRIMRSPGFPELLFIDKQLELCIQGNDPELLMIMLRYIVTKQKEQYDIGALLFRYNIDFSFFQPLTDAPQLDAMLGASLIFRLFELYDSLNVTGSGVIDINRYYTVRFFSLYLKNEGVFSGDLVNLFRAVTNDQIKLDTYMAMFQVYSLVFAANNVAIDGFSEVFRQIQASTINMLCDRSDQAQSVYIRLMIQLHSLSNSLTETVISEVIKVFCSFYPYAVNLPSVDDELRVQAALDAIFQYLTAKENIGSDDKELKYFIQIFTGLYHDFDISHLIDSVEHQFEGTEYPNLLKKLFVVIEQSDPSQIKESCNQYADLLRQIIDKPSPDADKIVASQLVLPITVADNADARICGQAEVTASASDDLHRLGDVEMGLFVSGPEFFPRSNSADDLVAAMTPADKKSKSQRQRYLAESNVLKF